MFGDKRRARANRDKDLHEIGGRPERFLFLYGRYGVPTPTAVACLTKSTEWLSL
jgi:hypothetical protein